MGTGLTGDRVIQREIKSTKKSLSLLFSSEEPAARVDVKGSDPRRLLEPRVARILSHERVLPGWSDPKLELGGPERSVRRRARRQLRRQQQPGAEHAVEQRVGRDGPLHVGEPVVELPPAGRAAAAAALKAAAAKVGERGAPCAGG